MLWDVLLQNASERIWLRMFWHIDLWKKIYYVFSKESFVLHQHGWGIFSATLKSFSRFGMVNLVCIVQSSFQRYRQITMILVQNKVNSNSCLVKNIVKKWYKAHYDKMKKKEEQTILLMSAICYMKVADKFFDRKMDGGILWQKIKRKMKLQ